MQQAEIPIQLATCSWINGEPLESISAFDRGLHYGDGFFTTVLVMSGVLCNWSAHWRRLSLSARRLQFALMDEQQLLQQISQALSSDRVQTVIGSVLVLKIMMTRGQAGRGYQIPKQAEMITLLQLSNAPAEVKPFFEQGGGGEFKAEALSISLCLTQASIQPQLAGLKHLSRLESVLARSEVINKGEQEGLMLNALQNVISGTQSNLFIIKNKQLITPKLDLSGVEGTTRYQLSIMAEELGYQWLVEDIKLEHLQQADELFLTNAIRGIMPVQQLESKQYSVIQTQKIHQAWLVWQQNNVLKLEHIENTKDSL
ncbi:MAG: 4-amino-4-deoxychorismate lyase [Thiomicrorhabdus sp.]|nr:MAG: 4-amino-4-deoxychorismate lyase [Thiomicrorhabdus sp.]